MSEAKLERFQVAHGPVTFSIGFLEAECETARQSFEEWNSRLFASVQRKSIAGDLMALISHLEPLTAPPQRSLLIPTRSKWTAYLDNFINGTDAFGPIGYLAEALNCRGVIVTFVPSMTTHSKSAQTGAFEAVQFELFGPGSEDLLGCLRSIGVVSDGGRLRFDASGIVQPFEDIEHYERQLVNERFTPAMLDRYATALGINAFDEAFYHTEAELLFYANTAPARQCSIAEARQAYGLM